MFLARGIIIIIICIVALIWLMQDERKGICFSIFMLILMPRELYVKFGTLPSVTIYRAMIAVLMFYFLFLREKSKDTQKIPFLSLLCLIVIQKLCSLFIAYDFSASLNGVVKFTFEILIFYYIIVKVIQNWEEIDSLLGSISAAILTIAIIGFIENYTHFNPFFWITTAPRIAGRVYSTFDHQIHFGYALAMGWPLCLYFLDKQIIPGKKRLIWMGLLPLYGGLYFSHSRGAWLGFIVSAMVLFFLRYPRINIKVTSILILTAFVLILRPGVYHTIYGLSATTLDSTSREGGSVSYRIDLFHKAYSEIQKSSSTLYFGYGDGAHHSMDLSGHISYGTFGVRPFWSWDSEIALILLEGGILGLALNLLLYLSVSLYLFKRIRFLKDEDKAPMIAVMATVSVFVFMLTNVAVFSPSLHYIFWTCVAIGVIISRENYSNESNVSKEKVT